MVFHWIRCCRICLNRKSFLYVSFKASLINMCLIGHSSHFLSFRISYQTHSRLSTNATMSELLNGDIQSYTFFQMQFVNTSFPSAYAIEEYSLLVNLWRSPTTPLLKARIIPSNHNNINLIRPGRFSNTNFDSKR